MTLPGQVPAFTAADVRAYYTASKGFPGLRTPDFKAPPIESITFMSAGQAEATIMHHGSLGLSANALVCVVAVGGPVIRVGKGGVGRLTIPGTPTDTPAPTPIAVPAGTVVAYMIFDASTGNLLAYGG